MRTKFGIVEDPGPFNHKHKTSKIFVVAGVLVALGLIAYSVWIRLNMT